MSDLYETEFEGENGEPLYETEDGRLVDESGEEYSWGDDDDDSYDELAEYAAGLEQQLAVRQAVQEAFAGWQQQSHEEHGDFDSDFHNLVETVQREQGRTLTDKELNRMYHTARRASADPTVESDSEVWKLARKEAMDLDKSEDLAAYIDQRMAESQEAQDEIDAETEPATQTPGETLEDLEKAESDYRERVEAVLAGDYSEPVEPEYQPMENQ
jgi:hypothetical protein